jgi:TPR repeat protein
MLDEDKKDYYKNLDTNSEEKNYEQSFLVTFVISIAIIIVLGSLAYYFIGSNFALPTSKDNKQAQHTVKQNSSTSPKPTQSPRIKRIKKRDSKVIKPLPPKKVIPKKTTSTQSTPVKEKKIVTSKKTTPTQSTPTEIKTDIHPIKREPSKFRPLPNCNELTIIEIRKQASVGNPHAQAILGIAYLYGDFDLRQNPKKAKMWIKLAASENDPLALFTQKTILSSVKNNNLTIPPEYTLKHAPFLLAVIGHYYESKRNYKQSFHFYLASSMQNCSLGNYYLGHSYRYGLGTTLNLKQAEAFFKKAAKNNLSKAYTALGEIYLNKSKSDKNLQQAIAFLKKGVEKNDPSSFFYLANCYADGIGLFVNETKAKKLYGQAVSKGIKDAAFPYAYYLDKNDQNWSEALKWYNVAIKNGDDQAALTLGDYYATGKHFQKDYKKALELYSIAMKKDNPSAFFNIGEFLSNGTGIQRDLGKAATFYQKAATLNLPKAQLKLSSLYEQGLGVPRNIKEAIHWAILASKQGYTPAKKQINYLLDKQRHTQLVRNKFKLEEKLRVALHNCLYNDFSKKSILKLRKLLPKIKHKESRYSLLVTLYFISFAKQQKQDTLTFKNQILNEFPNRPGVELQFSDVNMTCPICYGKGVVTHKCSRCRGTGICPRCHGRKQIGDERIGVYECITCHGNGICPKCNGERFLTTTCPVCHGAGKFASSTQAKKQAILLIKKIIQQDQILY